MGQRLDSKLAGWGEMLPCLFPVSMKHIVIGKGVKPQANKKSLLTDACDRIERYCMLHPSFEQATCIEREHGIESLPA